MKKLLFGAMLFASVSVFPLPALAEVNVGVSVSLPPLIVFAAPPEVVVIPETYVYVVPDVDVDIFFYDGWWWRPWEGRWYRSRHYDSGWAYYRRVPSFYRRVPSGWRNDYRDHRWRGHQWNHQRIPHQQVQKNWGHWKKTNHWERQQTWGVQGLKSRTRSQEAQSQHRRPKTQPVKPHVQEERRPQQSRPQSRKVEPQRSQPQHREAPQQSRPRQGKPERGEEERRERN